MRYRSLGRTGTMVSELCLGCMMFGWKTGEADSMDIIDRAVDAGINFLDTANVYSRGRSEEIVGKALKRNGKRDRIVLATKVHGRMADDDPNAFGNGRRHIIEQCDASLRRLQTDWIDLYQIHRPLPSVPIDETLRALDDLVRSGKVRHLGTSSFAAWQIVESLWVSKEYGLNRFVCEQPPYHLLDRRVEREVVPVAESYGIGIIPWSPLASGFLTGKYRRGQSSPPDARLTIGEGEFANFDERAYDVVEALETIADGHGCSVSQAALSWVKDRPAVTAPIIGPRTMEQLEDNLGSVDVVLTEADLKKLDAVSEPTRAIIPYYRVDYGMCRYRW